MTAAEMTDALVQINDQLAKAARSRGAVVVRFFCECGDCLADDVSFPVDEHEEIRAREDLIFARGHEASRRYHPAARIDPKSTVSESDLLAFDSVNWRGVLMQHLVRKAEHAPESPREELIPAAKRSM